MYQDEGFNIAALTEAINATPIGKKVLLLNFPNNPTGYSLTKREAVQMKQALLAAAEAGNKLVVLTDDAYFGLAYQDDIYEQSIFAELADLHENLLAVKIDGASKEDYAWGFRVGFITYGIKGGTRELYLALEAKTGGAIRGNISNAPAISQALLLKAYSHPEYAAQKREKFNTLKARYQKVRQILAEHPEYADAFAALPFNSGYFMCVRLKGAEPEAVRQVLLNDFSTGVIAMSGLIRLAFSSTPIDQLGELFGNLYQAVLKVRG
jgi:aspartate/methionine/tyrosine aminotransferase